MTSVWFRHVRYVFVAYVHVFLSHVEKVAFFHGFHLGFACCVVLAHVIVTI